MSTGGIPDKMGNDYEYCFGVRLLCDLLVGNATSVQEDDVTIEGVPLRVDYSVVDKDGGETTYQCKGTSGSNSRWSPSKLQDIFGAAILRFDAGHGFVFVSGDRPSIKNLMDNASHFRQGDFASYFDNLSKEDKKAIEEFRKVLPVSWQSDEKVFEFLQRFQFRSFGGEIEDVRSDILAAGLANTNSSYNFLYAYFTKTKKLGFPVFKDDLLSDLNKNHILFSVVTPQSVGAQIEAINKNTFQGMEARLIHGKVFPREAEKLSILETAETSLSTMISGGQGSGKTGLLYAASKALIKEDNVVLLVNLPDFPLTSDPSTFGKELGFDESPIDLFRRHYPNRKCFLVLDQLDTYLLNSEKTGVITSLVSRLIQQVNEQDNIHVVFTCRSLFASDFDLSFFKDSKKVSVENLTDDELEGVIGKAVVKGTPFFELLKNCFFLSLYVKLQNNQVKDYRDIMDSFIGQSEKMAAQRGITKERFWALIRYIVSSLARTAELSISQNDLEFSGGFSPSEIQSACDSGLLILNGGFVSFTHQAIFDYLVAQDAYQKVFSKKEGLVQYILESGQASFATLDSVHQLFQFLLQDPNHKKLDQATACILSSNDIRPTYKEIAFSALGSLSQPSPEECQIVLACLKGIERKQCLASACATNVTIGEYLYVHGDLNPDERENLLFSLSSEDSGFVSHQLEKGPFPQKFFDQLLDYLDPNEVSDGVFQKILTSIQTDSDRFFADNLIPLATNQPDRALRFLQAVIGDQEPQKDVRGKWFQAFGVVARKRPEEVLSLCEKYFQRKNRYWFRRDLNRDKDTLHSLILFLCGILFQNMNSEKKKSLLLSEKRNPIFQEILLDYLSRSESQEKEASVSLLLSDSLFFSFSFAFNDGLIYSLANFLKTYSPKLSDTQIAALYGRICKIRAPKISSSSKERLVENRQDPNLGPYWFPFSFEDEQFVLLTALPFERLPLEGQRYCAYLQRKFPNGSHRFYLDDDFGKTYSLVSPIAGKGASFSGKIWTRILTNKKTGCERDTGWFRGEGVSREYTMWSSEIQEAAKGRPSLFLNILHCHGTEIRPIFKESMVRGIIEGCSEKEKLDGFDDAVFQEEFFKVYPSQEVSPDFLVHCFFNECFLWKQEWIQKLFIAMAEDPRSDGDQTRNDALLPFELESSLINEVRPVSVYILSQMIRKGYLKGFDYHSLAASLAASPHTLDRMAVLFLLYGEEDLVWKKEQFIKLLDGDPRILDVEEMHGFLNAWIVSLDKKLTPIFFKAIAIEEKDFTEAIVKDVIAYYIYRGCLKEPFGIVCSSPKLFAPALRACHSLLGPAKPKYQKKFRELFVSLLGGTSCKEFAGEICKDATLLNSVIESCFWDFEDNEIQENEADIFFSICDLTLNIGAVPHYVVRSAPSIFVSLFLKTSSPKTKDKCFDYLDRFYLQGYLSSEIV